MCRGVRYENEKHLRIQQRKDRLKLVGGREEIAGVGGSYESS